MTTFTNPHDALRHHVTGAIERGEKTAIVAQPAIKTPSQVPLWADLAFHCHNGACNMSGLLRSMGKAAESGELSPGEYREHPAVKMVLGQLTYLCGETLGPSFEALTAYEEWKGSL